MFNKEWEGKLTGIKTHGDEGAHLVMATFVCAAEDSLFGPDSIGPAGRRAYKDVKAGKLGTTEVKMQARWLCNMTVSYMDGSGKAMRLKTSRAIPEQLKIVATKKSDEPPKVQLQVSIEYSERDGELVFLGRAHKKQLTVKLEGIQQGLPFGPDTTDVKEPQKRNGKAQAELPAAQV
jgi:hypothetical protein